MASGAVLAGNADAAVPRQVGSLTYTSTVPGSPTGLVLSFEFQNPDDPSLKPHTVTRMVVHSPRGAVTDTTVPAQCHATDAELMVKGPDGCPPDSKIGTAFVVSDTGGSGPFPRYTRTIITNFNNQDEVIGVGVNEDIPALKPVDRTKIRGNTTTSNFPLIPGGPPPEPFAAFKTFHFDFPPYVRGGRTYNRTPPACPRAGYWTLTLEFTYIDGVTESVESHSPCKRVRPRLTIRHRYAAVDRRGTVVDLRCEVARCTGTLRLEATGYSSRPRRVAAGKAVGFDLAAGTTIPVRIQVPAASRARLARTDKAVVRAVAKLSDGTVVRRLLSLYDR